MYKATKDFTSYTQGKKKKGDAVEFNQTLLNAGLIEEAVETKPAKNPEMETKPAKKAK